MPLLRRLYEDSELGERFMLSLRTDEGDVESPIVSAHSLTEHNTLLEKRDYLSTTLPMP